MSNQSWLTPRTEVGVAWGRGPGASATANIAGIEHGFAVQAPTEP